MSASNNGGVALAEYGVTGDGRGDIPMLLGLIGWIGRRSMYPGAVGRLLLRAFPDEAGGDRSFLVPSLTSTDGRSTDGRAEDGSEGGKRWACRSSNDGSSY